MPWCPNCKDEYKEGIKICADCGAELVDKLVEEKPEEFGDEFVADMIENPQDYSEAARELIKRADEFKLEIDEETKEEISASEEPVKLYVNNEELAEENRTSAYTLLVIGIIGLVAILLVAFDVIQMNFNITGKIMITAVMGGMFTVFIIMGIVSLKNFRVFKSKAASEKLLTDRIMAWSIVNLSKENIDCNLSLEGMSDEEKYFPRINYMKSAVNNEFPELDESYLNRLIEDVYGEVYGE